MIRSITFRVTLTLFIGLFTQLQMVVACEFMSGKTQLTCYCDNSGNMPTSCAMGNDCQNQDNSASGDTDCCAVSNQQVLCAIASAPVSLAQQVLLLDASQPTLSPFSSQNYPMRNQVVGFNNFYTTQTPSTKAYLLTHRLRI